MPSNEPTVFVSYSHKDEVWKDRLLPYLAVLEREGSIQAWSDREISTGDDWHHKILQAIDAASVAVLLVSENALASKYITEVEIPRLLERRDREGLRLIPVIVNPCPWQAVAWLRAMQVRPKDGRPLAAGSELDVREELAELGNEIHLLTRAAGAADEEQQFVPLPPDRIFTSKLPQTGREFFGRERELELLDGAWRDDDTRVLSLVAWGGVGKSALVNRWLRDMEGDRYRGAVRVYAWSFYSQGTGDQTASADPFFADALAWFGVGIDPQESAWEKGRRLAEAMRRERTLLLLDGLEPLQCPPGPQEGKLRDPGLHVLVREIAASNPGLCVITTRVGVAGLEDFQARGARQVRLDLLNPDAAVALLESLGAAGPRDQLLLAAAELGHHALAVRLLGTYVRDALGGDIARRVEIDRLTDELTGGGHATRVLASYESWLGAGPQRSVLRMLGLFSRPADELAVQALTAEPLIADLTESLVGLSTMAWKQVVAGLRRSGLLAEQDPHEPDKLDTHPLIREYFGESLKARYPEARRRGHQRLYEHYASATKELPETYQEMAPLFQAMIHGSHAEQREEVVQRIFLPRIMRGRAAFGWKTLGLWGETIGALRPLFTEPFRRFRDGLSPESEVSILWAVGGCLSAEGSVKEAIGPMEASLEFVLERGETGAASTAARILATRYRAIGEIKLAEQLCRRALDLAQGNEAELLLGESNLAEIAVASADFASAKRLFDQAEKRQQAHEPTVPYLYSLRGYEYCGLLLELGEREEIPRRANLIIELGNQVGVSLDSALGVLSLGRFLLSESLFSGDRELLADAGKALSDSLQIARRSGRLDMLPLVLVSCASHARMTGALADAREYLDEGLALVRHGGMRLVGVDLAIEAARIALADERHEEARAQVAAAESEIEDMGYRARAAVAVLVRARLALQQKRREQASGLLNEAAISIKERGQHGLDWELRELRRAAPR